MRPIYQKERLEEQMAELEIIHESQFENLDDTRRRLNQVSEERTALLTERDELSQEISKMKTEVATSKQDKATLDAQIKFMTYKFRLPTGEPAKTEEEVEIAKLLPQLN